MGSGGKWTWACNLQQLQEHPTINLRPSRQQQLWNNLLFESSLKDEFGQSPLRAGFYKRVGQKGNAKDDNLRSPKTCKLVPIRLNQKLQLNLTNR